MFEREEERVLGKKKNSKKEKESNCGSVHSFIIDIVDGFSVLLLQLGVHGGLLLTRHGLYLIQLVILLMPELIRSLPRRISHLR